MKSTFTVLSVCLFALVSLPLTAQTVDRKDNGAFQVKKNVLVTDETGAKFGDLKAEDLKLKEDGAEQEISALSVKTSPLYLEIVLDDSGSMASEKEKTIAAAKFIVQNLEPDSQVQIVRFGSPNIRVASDWTPDRSLLMQYLNERPVQSGGSPIYDSIWTALDQIKLAKSVSSDNRFAIVLISDCAENGSSHNLSDLLDELNNADVPLFTVALTEQLQQLARSYGQFSQLETLMKKVEQVPYDSALTSGGSVYFPQKGDNAKLPISESLKGLPDELRAQYRLTFTPKNQNHDGKERNLRIDIGDAFPWKKLNVAVKQTYVVPSLK
jgi:VWFA-related protein